MAHHHGQHWEEDGNLEPPPSFLSKIALASVCPQKKVKLCSEDWALKLKFTRKSLLSGWKSIRFVFHGFVHVQSGKSGRLQAPLIVLCLLNISSIILCYLTLNLPSLHHPPYYSIISPSITSLLILLLLQRLLYFAYLFGSYYPHLPAYSPLTHLTLLWIQHGVQSKQTQLLQNPLLLLWIISEIRLLHSTSTLS
jgi:hypothetical protein